MKRRLTNSEIQLLKMQLRLNPLQNCNNQQRIICIGGESIDILSLTMQQRSNPLQNCIYQRGISIDNCASCVKLLKLVEDYLRQKAFLQSLVGKDLVQALAGGELGHCCRISFPNFASRYKVRSRQFFYNPITVGTKNRVPVDGIGERVGPLSE